MQEYFENWGSIENPIRQSDLNSLFGSVHRCPKKFALSKIYPGEGGSVGYRMALGEIVHRAMENILKYDKHPNIKRMLSYYEKKKRIIYDEKFNVEYYQEMIDKIIQDRVFKMISKRVLDVERSFLVEIDGYYLAGTIDVIIKGKNKNEAVIIDWKTGSPKSQYEMDHGYQTQIYRLAVEKGTFFLRPEDTESGKDYYKSYKKTGQKNQFKKKAKVIFAHLNEVVPARRDTERKCRHYSAEKMAEDGKVKIKKGFPKGPIYYETRPTDEDYKRLVYAVRTAVAMGESGLFPEAMGQHCERCHLESRCVSFAMNNDMKQEVMGVMQELGIF